MAKNDFGSEPLNTNYSNATYDPNKDYSLAIVNAQKSGASEATIKQLQQERQNKINAQYGGKDPYKGSSNIMGTSGGSTGTVTPNYRQEAYDAAARGSWDAVGTAINKIGMQTPNKYGGYDMTEANNYMQELQQQFGYNANDYYRKQYDAVYGDGAWDGGTGAGQPVYNAFSDALVQMYNQSAAQNGVQGQQSAQQALQSLQGATGAAGFQTMGGYDDMTQYINDMYAQNLEAELAALKSAYDSNVAELENQNDKIAEQFRTARNQAAGQNALEAQRMNEIGIAQGLNTGATGQMALAQNMAYQGSLGNLWAQEAQTQADVGLALAQLLSQYNGQVQQSKAANGAELAAALYDELLRQQEWDYDKAIYQNQQVAASRKDAYDRAMTMLSYGMMPDAASLAAAGMSGAEAAVLLQAALGGTTATGSSAGGTVTTGSGKGSGSGYTNGSLTAEQVKVLQNYYGVTTDGMWGTNSTNAAGGLTADEAWTAYEKGPLRTIEQEVGMNRTSSGQANAIQRAYTEGRITEAQVEALLVKFGLA